MLVGAQVSLRFARLDWPVFLTVVAAAAMAWEILCLFRGVLRHPARAALHAAAVAALAALLVLAWPVGAIAAIGGCAVLWVLRSYGRTTSPLQRPWRLLLPGLRVAVLALLTGWALRPTLSHHWEVPVRQAVLVAVDASSSMKRQDAVVGGSAEPARRADAVRQAMRANLPALGELAAKADLELFLFDAQAKALTGVTVAEDVELLAQAEPIGPATAIGDSVAEALDPFAARKQEVAAIVVISDGCNNTSDVIRPDRMAALMASRGVPVHAVGVGAETAPASTEALWLKDLTCPEEVDCFNRLPVSVVCEAIGLEGRTVVVRCLFAGKPVGEETIPVGERQFSRAVRFNHIPEEVGFHRLSVQAEVQPKPTVPPPGRGELSQLVHVVDRSIRILYVEGRFRYECKYVAQALGAGRNFSVDRRILVQPPGTEPGVALAGDEAAWMRYHAFVFGDVAASQFSPAQLELLRRLVAEHGKGFCMLGGTESFGRGGWARTPIADLMPVDLASSGQQVEGPLKVIPTAEGRTAEMMRIGEEGQDVGEAWAKLRALPGANLLAGVKPGATVLARSAAGDPLIVLQQYGKGRVLAVAFDSTWRWVLSPDDTADRQKRFWRQAAWYLAAPKGHVWIATDHTSYDLRRLQAGAEAVHVTAGVEDATGEPAAGAVTVASLIGPDDKSIPLSLQADGQIQRTRLRSFSAPGTYRLNISAELHGRTLTAEHQFQVVPQDMEADDILADFASLRDIAAASGGEFVELFRLGALLRRLQVSAAPKSRDVSKETDLSAAARWPLAVVLIALLCAEWALRKRRGLV